MRTSVRYVITSVQFRAASWKAGPQQRQHVAPGKIGIRLAIEDFQILQRQLPDNLRARLFVGGGDDRAMPDAPVTGTAEDNAFLPGRQLKEVQHFPDSGGVVQSGAGVQGEAAFVQAVFVQKTPGAVLDFDPLNQIPLEQAQALPAKVLENLLVTGKGPAEMPAAIIAGVEMERRVEALAPLLSPLLAFRDEQGVAAGCR